MDQDYAASAKRLSNAGWDSDELVACGAQHIEGVIDRFEAGEISATEVEDWANLIEGREHIAMSETVTEGIYWLANPTLNYVLDGHLIDKIRVLLRQKG